MFVVTRSGLVLGFLFLLSFLILGSEKFWTTMICYQEKTHICLDSLVWWRVGFCDNIFTEKERKSCKSERFCEGLPTWDRHFCYWLEARPVFCEPPPPEWGWEFLGVLVGDQTIVLVEVVTLRTHVFMCWRGWEIEEYVCEILTCLVVYTGKLRTRFRIVLGEKI